MLFKLVSGLFATTLFTSASFASTAPPADQMSPEAAEESGKVSIVVTGRATDLIGSATAASEGIVGKVDLEDRPIQRIAELLEVIPGFIATQHSGGGKANQ